MTQTEKYGAVLKQNAFMRWIILFLVSISVGATYYVYDAISTLKETMLQQLNFSSTQYGLIVSFYSFPNTFLLLGIIGGVILDRLGIKKTGTLFLTACVIGAFLTAFGASTIFKDSGFLYKMLNSFLPSYSAEFKMMALGRFFFGLGAETFIVVINKIIAKWFKGKEMGLAFGFNIVICRLGTAGALILSPILKNSPMGWTVSLWTAAVIMFVGWLFFFIYLIIDKKESASDSKLDASEEFRVKDIWVLLQNKSFLYITLLCLTFYSAVFPFQSYAPDILHNKFNLSEELAGILTSIIIWGTIVFTPIFGRFVDKKGLRASLMIYGSAMLVVVHLIIGLTGIHPYLPMFVLGIAFSLVPAAMWPSIPLIVPEKTLGTAYGVMTSIQNLGLWGIPILAGYITDVSNPNVTPKMLENGTGVLNYTNTMIMFAILGLIGLGFAIILRVQETGKNKFGLEEPSK